MVMLGITLLMAMIVSCNCQGGTSYCVLPFVYRNVIRTDCITEGDPDGKLWCSTKTDNQNNHINGLGNWRHCTGEFRGPSFCKFPFIYKNVQYGSCTTTGDPAGQLWCSTKTDNLNNHIQGNFRNCIQQNTGQQLVPTSQQLVPTSQELIPTFIPKDDECGQSLRENVVGGELTEAGDWPWLAALGRKDTSFSPFCGGTLITKQHVISAAHCFLRVTTQDTIVRLGEYHIHIDDDGAQDFNIIDERVGNYNQNTRENDIILLKLDKPLISFTDSIRAACLPYHLRNDKFEGKTHEVVGWGKFNINIERISPIPLLGRVAVVPIRDCLARYNNLYKIDDRQLCAGTGVTDSCQEDSGGPLNYLDLKKARFYVVGIVSFGPVVCGSTNRPGVYARVGSYLDWIEDNIKQML